MNDARSSRLGCHALVAISIIFTASTASIATAQLSCAGDCSRDGRVDVSEFARVVAIAIGDRDASSCSAADANKNGTVGVADVIAAVDNGLHGCPNGLVSGTCTVPGPAGGSEEVGCPPGIPVIASSCRRGARCIGPRSGLTFLGAGAVETPPDGGISIPIRTGPLSNADLLVEAKVSDAVSYYDFELTPPSADGSRVQRGCEDCGIPIFTVDINVSSTATARVLDESGVQNFTVQSFGEISDRIDATVSTLDLQGLDPAAAAELANGTLCVGCGLNMAIGTSTGHPGDVVEIEVRLNVSNSRVVALQNDIEFDPNLISIALNESGRPDCEIPPGGKDGTVYALRPPGCIGADCTGLRALVISFEDISPIPDGSVLYTCRAKISPAAPVGDIDLRCENNLGSDEIGNALSLPCSSGSVTVTAP